MADGYTLRKWSGLDNWKCDEPECIYDSFDEDDVKRHIEAVHGPDAPAGLQRANQDKN